MNEYQIAIFAGFIIAGLWFLAYIFCWVCQWVWSWVDDSEASNTNWLSSKINFSKYRYRVYNDSFTKENRPDKERLNGDGYNRFSKNKEDEGRSIHSGKGIDYKCSFETFGGIITVGFFTSLLPIALLCSFKVYPLTLSLLLLICIAYITRFARRNKKMFDSHVEDKDAHK